MKVLLISPRITAHMIAVPKRPGTYEPLGLLYLAAYIRERGHEPVVLDCVAEGWQTCSREGEMACFGLDDAAIGERIRAVNPDLIGIACMFTGYERDAMAVAAVARETAPDVPILIGGADATFQAEAHVQTPNVDLVVRGEGEVVLANVLEYYAEHGKLPEDMPGTVVPGRTNPDEKLIGNLDTLPMPARDLVCMETYLDDQSSLMPYAKRTPIGFIISSRGCPYNCLFCSTRKVWKRWRPRSPEKVVDEIEFLVNEHGIREIAFQDDSFLTDKARVEGICNEIIRRKIKISWTVPPGLTIWTVTGDILAAMAASGFYRACFPIESGDPEILKFLRKDVDLDKVDETIDICNNLGLWTYGNFIIGFPEQTPESVEMTARYAANCRLDMISVYIAQPYAGSDLYDVFERLNLLEGVDAEGSTVFASRYDTVHFKAEELCAKRDEIYSRFTKNRLKRLTTLRGLNDMRHKVNSPERFIYGCRVFYKFVSNSLAARKITLLKGV